MPHNGYINTSWMEIVHREMMLKQWIASNKKEHPLYHHMILNYRKVSKEKNRRISCYNQTDQYEQNY